MTEASDTTTWRALAAELATNPATYRKLLRLHVDVDGRCRACTRAGTGTPGATWPCTVQRIAALAQEIHDHALRRRSG